MTYHVPTGGARQVYTGAGDHTRGRTGGSPGALPLWCPAFAPCSRTPRRAPLYPHPRRATPARAPLSGPAHAPCCDVRQSVTGRGAQGIAGRSPTPQPYISLHLNLTSQPYAPHPAHPKLHLTRRSKRLATPGAWTRAVGVAGDEELREEGGLPDVLAHVSADSVVGAFFEPLWLLLGTLQVHASARPMHLAGHECIHLAGLQAYINHVLRRTRCNLGGLCRMPHAACRMPYSSPPAQVVSLEREMQSPILNAKCKALHPHCTSRPQP